MYGISGSALRLFPHCMSYMLYHICIVLNAMMLFRFGPIGAWVLSQTSSNRIQMPMSAAVIFQLYWIVSDVIIHDAFFILLSLVFVIVWSSVCVVIAVGGMIQSSSATTIKETR